MDPVRASGQPCELRLELAPKSDALEKVLSIARIRRIQVRAMSYVAPTERDGGEIRLHVTSGAARSVVYLTRAVGVTSVQVLPDI